MRTPAPSATTNGRSCVASAAPGFVGHHLLDPLGVGANAAQLHRVQHRAVEALDQEGAEQEEHHHRAERDPVAEHEPGAERDQGDVAEAVRQLRGLRREHRQAAVGEAEVGQLDELVAPEVDADELLAEQLDRPRRARVLEEVGIGLRGDAQAPPRDVDRGAAQGRGGGEVDRREDDHHRRHRRHGEQHDDDDRDRHDAVEQAPGAAAP